MKPRTVRTRAAGAARLVAAAAGLAAPPTLLWVIIGSPLPSLPIDWASVVEAIQAGLIPSSVWVNVLALVAWLAWLLLIGMLTVEVVAIVRNRPSTPGVPRWIRNLAQALVAAAITLSGPGQHALAASTAIAPITVAEAPVHGDHDGTTITAQPIAEGRLVTVEEEDSWRGFAERVLGDASLGPILRTANVGRDVGGGHNVSETTAFVEHGWQLLIPAHLDSAPVLASEPTSAAVDEDDADPHMWDVRKGDHLWGIAEATLADAWGRQPTDAEILPFWRQLIETNTDRLLPPEDPDLIYPGQQFTVPSPPPDPTDTGDDQAAASSPATDQSGEPPSENAPTDDLPPRPETDRPDADGSSTGRRWQDAIEGDDLPAARPPEASSPADGWRSAIEGRDADVPADPSEPADLDDEARTALGAPTGLTAGVAAITLLAAGVVATIRWRRRTTLQQRGPGMRLPTPLPEVDEEVARLDAAAATDQPLEDLTALLCSIPPNVHPVLVRVSDHGEVTLFFDEQQALPEPPAPWTLADDGTDGPVGWQATLGDMGVDRSFGLPLLVTLGRSGTSTLLANVAAMGVLGIDGPPAEERRRLRAMSLEVATSRITVPVEVAIAGDERLASLDRVRHIDHPADEVELAMDELEEGVVVDDRTPRLLVCHHDVTPPAIPAELTGMVGAVATGQDAHGRRWVLHVEDEHTGRLRLPDGGTVQLALPDIDPEVIDDELTRLDQTPDVVAVEPEGDVAADSVDPSTNGHPAVHPARPTEPAWCEVRLLGPVEVIRDGKPVDGLPPRALEMLAYLVTHPGGVPKERLDNVMWAGRRAGGGTQRVTSALIKLRGSLGDGPDGNLLVPRRLGDEPIVLSSHVGCDLDRALAHLDPAADLPADLRAREVAVALELVRGEPFDGKPYSWATDIAQRAIVRLQDAALEAVSALRDAEDLDAADRVIQQGLKLLDPNGWLYLERAELERLRGHPEQPPRIFEQYRRKLADDADEIAGTVATPPPEIELAFRELMARI